MRYYQHKTQLEGVLHTNKELFEPSETLTVKPTQPLNSKVSMYIPDSGNKTLRLRGGVGYLSGAELIQLRGRDEIEQILTYSYTFCLEDHTYICRDNNQRTQSNPFPYMFRYDKDTRDIPSHPSNHLHVIHEIPRFRSANINLEIFLEFLKANFYDKARKTWIKTPHWERT